MQMLNACLLSSPVRTANQSVYPGTANVTYAQMTNSITAWSIFTLSSSSFLRLVASSFLSDCIQFRNSQSQCIRADKRSATLWLHFNSFIFVDSPKCRAFSQPFPSMPDLRTRSNSSGCVFGFGEIKFRFGTGLQYRSNSPPDVALARYWSASRHKTVKTTRDCISL